MGQPVRGACYAAATTAAARATTAATKTRPARILVDPQPRLVHDRRPARYFLLEMRGELSGSAPDRLDSQQEKALPYFLRGDAFRYLPAQPVYDGRWSAPRCKDSVPCIHLEAGIAEFCDRRHIRESRSALLRAH